jgi:hypothetical protein
MTGSVVLVSVLWYRNVNSAEADWVCFVCVCVCYVIEM